MSIVRDGAEAICEECGLLRRTRRRRMPDNLQFASLAQAVPGPRPRNQGGEVSTPERAITFIVPLVPPSVNHYAKHTRDGKHYTTDEATAFKDAVATFAGGRFIQSKTFSVRITVVLGKGGKGDVDNFPKLVLDGMAACGVFRDKNGKRVSDAHVDELMVSVDRRTRPDRGYTITEVRAL